MAPLALLALLRGSGITVRAVGDRVRVTPAARLTPELQELIRTAKTGLLDVLTPVAAILGTVAGADMCRVHVMLSQEDRVRLDRERSNGDRLATIVLTVIEEARHVAL